MIRKLNNQRINFLKKTVHNKRSQVANVHVDMFSLIREKIQIE